MVILDGYNLTINNLDKIAHNCEQGKIKKSQWSKTRLVPWHIGIWH